MADGKVEPGQITTRDEMSKVFGGSTQGGIVPSRSTPSILIYTDPETGERSGYRDGWLKEEDEHGPILEYTGHGEGDQTFLGNKGTGNRAILRHVDKGRALHVFKAVGKVPGTNTKLQRYIGQFELDAGQPYVMRQAANTAGALRRVIVFQLRPIGPFEHLAEDDIPPAEKTEAVTVPADVTTSAIIEPETNKKTVSARSAVPQTKAERREAKLTDDFQAFMKAQHREMKRFQIKVKGLTSPLQTDLYDATAHVLYEAKGSSSREAVRMAIGQLLDYRRHVTPVDPTLAVLLPEEPHEDLRALLASANIAVVYQDGGTFFGVPA